MRIRKNEWLQKANETKRKGRKAGECQERRRKGNGQGDMESQVNGAGGGIKEEREEER
jgi:hypothetical protein